MLSEGARARLDIMPIIASPTSSYEISVQPLSSTDTTERGLFRDRLGPYCRHAILSHERQIRDTVVARARRRRWLGAAEGPIPYPPGRIETGGGGSKNVRLLRPTDLFTPTPFALYGTVAAQRVARLRDRMGLQRSSGSGIRCPECTRGIGAPNPSGSALLPLCQWFTAYLSRARARGPSRCVWS